MQNLVLVGLFLSLVACGNQPSSSDLREIASDYSQPFQHSLYWRNGDQVHRAFCRNGTTIYDHASCNVQPVAVPTAAFYHELETQFGVHTEQLSDLGAESFVRVEQIDLKLLELLNSDGGTPQRPELPAQIRAKEGGVNSLTTTVAGLRDQSARIHQRLAERDNANLRLQLAELGKQIGEQTTKLVFAQAQLAALRQEYVEANSSVFDAEMYRHLQNQREAAVNVVDAYQTYTAQQAQESIRLRRVLGMLEDNYIYVEDMGSGSGTYMSYIMPFDEIIDDLAQGATSFTKQGDASMLHLAVEVPRVGSLKRLQCHFATAVENRCLEVAVTAPFGETRAMPNRYVNTRNFSDRIMAHAFINRGPTQGIWQFELKNLCDDRPLHLTAAPWCEVGVD